MTTLALGPTWLTPDQLIQSFGLIGIMIVVFAESGLLIGFFLPGDSLLFTAGLFTTTSATATVHLNLGWVLAAAGAGALLGAQTGYLLGRRGGPALLNRTGNPKLRQAVERSSEMLEKYGYGKAIVLARFIPLVRTVLNPMAGALGVPVRAFTGWQIVGGLAWSLGVTLAGHALGSSIPNIDHYLLPIIALLVVLSLIPIALEIRKARRTAATAESAPAPDRESSRP